MNATQKTTMIGMLRAGLELLESAPEEDERYAVKLPGAWLQERTPAAAAEFIDPAATYTLSVLDFFRLFNYLPERLPPSPPSPQLPLSQA